MINYSQLEILANDSSPVCLTLSLNTHRTHPDNLQDAILLKNLCKEAENRLIAEFGKRAVEPILIKLEALVNDLDVNYLLDSLHIFVSENTLQMFRLPFAHSGPQVQIAHRFNLRALIKAYNRVQPYFILLLSQSGTQLYNASWDQITEELTGEGFPFPANPHFHTSGKKLSDPNAVDDLVRHYFNGIDKALQQMHHRHGHRCVVVSTEDNYSRLLQVADQPSVYLGYAAVDYNQTKPHQLALQALGVIQAKAEEERQSILQDLQAAISAGKLMTDVQEIFKAIKEGRGDTLALSTAYNQAARISDSGALELLDDATTKGAIDDLGAYLAWEVMSKKGQAYFFEQGLPASLGAMALKLRY